MRICYNLAMKLLLIRHGECEANIQGVVAGGGNDSPLTSQGRADAQLALAQVKKSSYRIDAIVSSPLSRAKDTANIIAAGLGGMEVIVCNSFTELNVGTASGMPLADYFALEKSGEPIPSAEVPQQFFDRVQIGLRELKERYEEDDTVLLVSHNGTCRMIACVLNGLPAEHFSTMPKLANGELRMVEL